MAHQVFAVPNYSGTSTDVLFCNPSDPNSNGVVHYAYAVGAEADSVTKRTMPWAKVQDFAGDYGKQHPAVIQQLTEQVGYRPGDLVLGHESGPTSESDQDTVMRLGALELLANLSSGRLSTTDKDPFPHQLALQQFVRKPPQPAGLRRLLIADEVGLGKTIEAGLILRDMLLARGTMEGFRCLYLTSGGLVEDAADKLRDVLAGTIDDRHIVNAIDTFTAYGDGNTQGVYVGSMHAARLYTSKVRKGKLPKGVRPQVVIIDECHHAASEGDLAGAAIRRQDATQTYLAALQLLTGEFWQDSEPPPLAILMSATPFRSQPQFVNLLRLLTHGITRPDLAETFDAYATGVQANELRGMLQNPGAAASVVWRRQSDDSVRSWTGSRIFPNLTIVRPHTVAEADPSTPRLPAPSSQFLELLRQVKDTVTAIAQAHGQQFGGFARAQLEKKLTSSSVAGACWLFSWAARHSHWDTQIDYRNDKGVGAESLRRLILLISQRIASYSGATKHADVRFPSDGFVFEASSLAKGGSIVGIQVYSKAMRDRSSDDGLWVATQEQVAGLVQLAENLLDLQGRGGDKVGAEDAKLAWLKELLVRHPDDRFLLFTESLQTCEALQSALGTVCRTLVGSMSKAARNEAVADLQNPRMNARVLVATSAADEGFDLQVACKVIHWDLSSSPATLMQRNGRVARLGQAADVTAYYLILTGTHEQLRDSALQRKFAELGIDNEALRSTILGSLSEEEEDQLSQAIASSQDRIVGDILRRATDDNAKMTKELDDIRTELKHAQVLSRGDLALRLDAWKRMGPPGQATRGVKFEFDTVSWERPVFSDVSRREATTSKVARFEGKGDGKQLKEQLVFDPEFLIFGPTEKGQPFKLAGIPPWVKKVSRHEKSQIEPYDQGNLIGRLLHNVARLSRADFLAIRRPWLDNVTSMPPAAARWLLFCTHPLREAENTLPAKSRPLLTYYAFAELTDELPCPLDAEGADGEAVHAFIRQSEVLALQGLLDGVNDPVAIAASREAGTRLRAWLESVTKFGAASFLEAAKYFVPVPVALIQVTEE